MQCLCNIMVSLQVEWGANWFTSDVHILYITEEVLRYIALIWALSVLD